MAMFQTSSSDPGGTYGQTNMYV